MIFMRSHFFVYQIECDSFVFQSINHEEYLQLVKKSTLSQFDDKRC